MEVEVALHEDVVEGEEEAHQHEHLDHLHVSRHLQRSRHTQQPGVKGTVSRDFLLLVFFMN